MTKQQLKDKVNSMLKDDEAYMQKLLDKAVNSSAIDVEGAEDNFILPKIVLTAMYKEMANQRHPISNTRFFAKQVNDLYTML